MNEHDHSPPALNVPRIVLTCAAVLIAVHALLTQVLPETTAGEWLLSLAFIPDPTFWVAEGARANGASIWSVLSYALVHGDWTHLGINILWLVAFGSPVARRFGVARFMFLSVVAAAAGAGTHWLFHMHSAAPLVGASGAVSAYFGAATRFAMHGGFNLAGREHEPALTLTQTLTNAGTLGFIVVWLGVNLVFGSGVVPVAGQDVSVAWEAHVGGFVVGLFMFDLFDPPRGGGGDLFDRYS